MKFLLSSALVALSFLPAVSARADVWFWQDDKTGLTVTFPDTWAMITNRAPDDILTIAAPGGDRAMCRIRAREDRRFMIYPVSYMSSVQKVAYSREFWERYMNGDYDLVSLDAVQDGAGLGRGNASYAVATFDAPGPENGTLKRGLMFAALYNDTAYIADCSADASAYNVWAPAFQGIMKSIDFKKVYHERPTGHYRKFLED